MKELVVLLVVMVLLVSALVNVQAEQVIADFEGWPNCLGGEMGIYGSVEPDWSKKDTTAYSWVYETICKGYDKANIHSGKQSWRLVTGIGSKPDETWGSFAMDLGSTIDLTVTPKKVKSFNASKYSAITFWVKGDKGGEKMSFLARDGKAVNYMPQVKISLPEATIKWTKVTIPLSEISKMVDISQIDNIGLAFGPDVGNTTGAMVYLDDFMFE